MGKRTRRRQRAWDMRKQPQEAKRDWQLRMRARLIQMQVETLEAIHRTVEGQ